MQGNTTVDNVHPMVDSAVDVFASSVTGQYVLMKIVLCMSLSVLLILVLTLCVVPVVHGARHNLCFTHDEGSVPGKKRPTSESDQWTFSLGC